MKKHLPLTLTILCWLVTASTFGQTADSQAIKGLPVLFHGDTLFLLHGAPMNITIQERKSLIEERLNRLDQDNLVNPDSILVTPGPGNIYRTSYHDLILFTTNPSDTAYSDLTLKELAVERTQGIKDAFSSGIGVHSFTAVLKRVGEALVVILLLVFFIWLINRGFRWGKSRWIGRRPYKPVYAGKYELLPEALIRSGIVSAFSLFRWVFIILLVYLSLPLIFSLFPWTKPIANELLGYIIRPAKDILKGIVHYIPNLFTIALIFFITRYVDKAIRFFTSEVERSRLTIPGFYSDWALPTYKIVKALLYVFMFIVIFPYLPGSQSKVFQGVSVFLGVLFSLGSSSAISNVVAGVVITYMRPFKIGDRVKIGNVKGDVMEKTLLVTRVRTMKHEEVTIPNATILSGETINFSMDADKGQLILHTEVTIGYDAPWKTVHELLIQAAKATPDLLDTPEPFVLQKALNDYYVAYEINAYTSQAAKMEEIYSTLHQNIQDAFNQAGVEIMSPAYSAIRDGNTVTIPARERPPGYEPDSFRVRRT